MKNIYTGALMLVVSTSLFFACSKSSSSDGSSSTSNDAFKTGMLTNYADTLVVPAYRDFQAKVNALETSVNSFLSVPSIATLDAVRPVFKDAYLSFEGISMPYLGPASSLSANNNLNSFPTTTTKIETAIQTGAYNFAAAGGVSDSIQGFPALDYLLFSSGSVAKFSATDAANRKKYVQDIIARMKSLAQTIISQWDGGYRASFISSLKTNVGSSIGVMVNQFAKEMDDLKGPRIGYPFGKQSNGIVFAGKCEAYYSGITKDLAVANMVSLRKYYMGGTGTGIDDYLILLGKQQLNSDVVAQFSVVISALQAIPDPMSAAFTGNAVIVENAYKEVQKLLTLIKTDVASATAVQITYMDNDGD